MTKDELNSVISIIRKAGDEYAENEPVCEEDVKDATCYIIQQLKERL